MKRIIYASLAIMLGASCIDESRGAASVPLATALENVRKGFVAAHQSLAQDSLQNVRSVIYSSLIQPLSEIIVKGTQAEQFFIDMIQSLRADDPARAEVHFNALVESLSSDVSLSYDLGISSRTPIATFTTNEVAPRTEHFADFTTPVDFTKLKTFTKEKRINWWRKFTTKSRDLRITKELHRTLKNISDFYNRLGYDEQTKVVDWLQSTLNLDFTDRENLVIKHPGVLEHLWAIHENKKVCNAIIMHIYAYELGLQGAHEDLGILNLGRLLPADKKEHVDKIEQLVKEDGVIGEIPPLITEEGYDMRTRICDWKGLLKVTQSELLKQKINGEELRMNNRLKLMMGTKAFEALQKKLNPDSDAFEWWQNTNYKHKYTLLVLHPKTLVKLAELRGGIRLSVIKQMSKFDRELGFGDQSTFDHKNDKDKQKIFANNFKIEPPVAEDSRDGQLIKEIADIVNEDYKGYFNAASELASVLPAGSGVDSERPSVVAAAAAMDADVVMYESNNDEGSEADTESPACKRPRPESGAEPSVHKKLPKLLGTVNDRINSWKLVPFSSKNLRLTCGELPKTLKQTSDFCNSLPIDQLGMIARWLQNRLKLDFIDKENLVIKHPGVLKPLCQMPATSDAICKAIVESIRTYEAQWHLQGKQLELEISDVNMSSLTEEEKEHVKAIKQLVEKDGVIGYLSELQLNTNEEIINWWKTVSSSSRIFALGPSMLSRTLQITSAFYRRQRVEDRNNIVKLLESCSVADKENLVIKHPGVLEHLCAITDETIRGAIVMSIRQYEARPDKRGQHEDLKISGVNMSEDEERHVNEIKRLVQEDGVVGKIEIQLLGRNQQTVRDCSRKYRHCGLLKDEMPKLFEQIDVNKTRDELLGSEDAIRSLTSGLQQKVYWKCPICQESYQSNVYSRVKGAICRRKPECKKKQVIILEAVDEEGEELLKSKKEAINTVVQQKKAIRVSEKIVRFKWASDVINRVLGIPATKVFSAGYSESGKIPGTGLKVTFVCNSENGPESSSSSQPSRKRQRLGEPDSDDKRNDGFNIDSESDSETEPESE